MSTKESIIYSHFATTLTLLGLGLTFTEIKNLSDTEVTMLIATHLSFEEYKGEQMERNAKHQQAAGAHPNFPKGY